MDAYQKFIYLRTYSRFLWEKGRRESWEETVNRFLDFIFTESPYCHLIPEKTKKKIRQHILNLVVVPSMRLLWSAGENARRDNTAAYNCSALAADNIGAFGEAMYLLLSSAGVGYSVEDRYISRLPQVKYQKNSTSYNYVVEDTRAGWKNALDFGIEAWFNGRDVGFDTSKIRPAGTPLFISGGYASGPDPLIQCLNFTRKTILAAQGRQLLSLEISDIFNEIASIVVAGGVRRASEICLSDFNDISIRDSKHGIFPHRRGFANISAVYHQVPNVLDFTQEFINMARSNSGERGMFNLLAARKRSPRRRDKSKIELTNPCAETLLRNNGLCNLTEVILRPTDDFESVRDKIITATWLGCIQSTLTNFPELNPKWAENAKEERLLGVSLSGLCDVYSMITAETLRHWKQIAVKTAKEASGVLGINMPAAVTLIKPSGTTSQLTNCSPGLHSRWSPYYLRRVRISMHDPLFEMMKAQGVPWTPCNYSINTAVLEFPVTAPSDAKFRDSETAIGQLEWYKTIVDNWCEHNASATIYVKDNEWLDVTAWVYRNFDSINGVTFFPFTNEKYKNPPFEEISYDEYQRKLEAFPEIDFSRLPDYEKTDLTTGGKEYACAGGACEL